MKEILLTKLAEKLFDDFYRILYEMFPLSFLLQKKIEKNTSGYFSYILNIPTTPAQYQIIFKNSQ